MAGKCVKIIVIGAGAAGLSAAHHLIQNGFQDVVILEGTNRIGGRINTVTFGDGIIELGANWIHGTGQDNSMVTLAESKGFIQKPYKTNSYEGQWLSERGTFKTEILQSAIDIFEKIEEELENGSYFGQITSCKEYFEKRLAEETIHFGNDEKTELRPVFNSLIACFGLYIGEDPNRLAAKPHDIGATMSDHIIEIPNGYSGILKTLQDEIPVNSIKFGRFVTRITWNNLPDNTGVKVVCKFGDNLEEYLADHVITTCSLGHLKQYHNSLFQPALPKDKIDAIERMGFGNVGKIFLQYESPFWVKGIGGFKLALESYDAQNEKLWHKSICLFSEVPTCPNTLLAWVHGNRVRYMESLPEKELGYKCTEILRKFLQNDKIPEPTQVCKSHWSTDPLFLGAYGYHAVNSKSSDVEVLAEPLLKSNKPVVCFAGEASHVKWFSFTHGARSSGLREALRLVRLYSGR